MNNRGCIFSRMGYTDCDGMLDAAHWVPKARIKTVLSRRGIPAEKRASIVWDARVTAPACRKHHTLFDQKTIRLTIDQYPQGFKDWALENNFEWRGPRDGWVGVHVGTGDAA